MQHFLEKLDHRSGTYLHWNWWNNIFSLAATFKKIEHVWPPNGKFGNNTIYECYFQANQIVLLAQNVQWWPATFWFDRRLIRRHFRSGVFHCRKTEIHYCWTVHGIRGHQVLKLRKSFARALWTARQGRFQQQNLQTQRFHERAERHPWDGVPSISCLEQAPNLRSCQQSWSNSIQNL